MSNKPQLKTLKITLRRECICTSHVKAEMSVAAFCAWRAVERTVQLGCRVNARLIEMALEGS